MPIYIPLEPKIIVVHDSATKDGKTVSWGAIRKYHMTDPNHKYIEIGYHAGVELVDDAYEALMGRPWDAVGAHTHGKNHHSLGLCIVGNFDLEEPPGAQLEKAAGIVRLWLKIYNLSRNCIFPHSFFNQTTCPGLKFNMTKFIELVD